MKCETNFRTIGGEGSQNFPTPLHRPTTLKYPRSGLKLRFWDTEVGR
nr:MAG TPA: hypothetical protein [Caudoviricetes sp.]